MSTSRRKVVLENPAYKTLAHAAEQLDKTRALDAPEAVGALVHNAQALLGNAMKALIEQDRLMMKIVMICLMFVQSTSYTMQKIHGKMEEVAEITDEFMWAWAVRELHSLPAKFKG